jgi:coproporphyrinogen III oxidase-like Fe-S oxidoreductase
MSAPPSMKRAGSKRSKNELEWTAESKARIARSWKPIFFGGGTPSLMAGSSVAQVLEKIARQLADGE